MAPALFAESVERKALLGRFIVRDCCKQAEVAGWYNDTLWSFFISNSLSHRRNEPCLFRWSAHHEMDGITVCKKRRCWIEWILQKWRIRWCRGVFLGVETLISPVRDGCYTATVTVHIQVSTLNVCDRCGVMWCGWPGCERSIFMLTNCQHILALMWTADAVDVVREYYALFFSQQKKKKERQIYRFFGERFTLFVQQSNKPN